MHKPSLCLPLLVTALITPAQGQITGVEPGSTVQGDVARGQGVFLQGLGWYELNDAKATAMNADTMMRLANWNREVQLAYRREYNAAVEQKNYRTKQAFQEAQRKRDEKEARLRTKPTPEDIEKGDALNAQLADLSDPTIAPYAWKNVKVKLDVDISIKSLAFQFAPKPGAKESAALTRGLIALGRLDTSRGWPDIFPLDKLTAEISAFENSYKLIQEESLAGRINNETVSRLDRSLEALEASVGKVVPTERGYRTAAIKHVRDLKSATKMFDATTRGYAREMIADTNKHEAHTVGELLAFMRKYRLLFAKADAAPGGNEMYERLYRLLRQQSEALGLKSEQMLANPTVTPPASSRFGPDTQWAGQSENGLTYEFLVHEVGATQFRARFKVGNDNIREITGKLSGNRISWTPADVEVIMGNAGDSNTGTIDADQIHMKWSGRGTGGEFTLTRQDR